MGQETRLDNTPQSTWKLAQFLHVRSYTDERAVGCEICRATQKQLRCVANTIKDAMEFRRRGVGGEVGIRWVGSIVDNL